MYVLFHMHAPPYATCARTPPQTFKWRLNSVYYLMHVYTPHARIFIPSLIPPPPPPPPSMHRFTHVHNGTYTSSHSHLGARARTHACANTALTPYIPRNIISFSLHARTHTHTYPRTYTRTRIHTYIHTHTHTSLSHLPRCKLYI